MPIVSSEPNEDVGSSELQHLNQSGPAPLPFSGIQFGDINWTDFCEEFQKVNLNNKTLEAPETD